jgi:hypothetical protein
MKTYKLNALKDKAVIQANGLMGGRFAENSQPAVIASILAKNLEGQGKNWRDNYEELRTLVIKTIDNWDVRNVKSLIALFPSIVNKSHAEPNAPCCVEIDDNGHWCVIFDSVEAL